MHTLFSTFQFMLLFLLKCGIVVGVWASFSNAQPLKDIKTFSADFTQILYSNDEGAQNKITYQGKIQALAPSNLRWSYQTPIPKEIFIQEGVMIVYEPKLKQAIFTRLQENINLLYLLKNAKKITENHYEAIISEQKYDLLLENGIPAKISFSDSLGNQVEICFKNAKINSTIDSALFEFKPTSEIDIIHN